MVRDDEHQAVCTRSLYATSNSPVLAAEVSWLSIDVFNCLLQSATES